MAARSTTNGSLCLYREGHSPALARTLRKQHNLNLKAPPHPAAELFLQALCSLNLSRQYHHDNETGNSREGTGDCG